MLENKLGITDSTELARTEEKISKQKALQEGGVSQTGYRYLQNGIQVMTKRITPSLRKRIQVYSKTERQIHILLQILLTENPIISIQLTVKLKKRLMRWRMSTHTLKSSRRTLNTITT